MAIYPEKIEERLRSLGHADHLRAATVPSRSASFVCGCFVGFSLRVENTVVSEAAFQSNGCGYMTTAAEVLTEAVSGIALSKLHGLDPDELEAKVGDQLDVVPHDRQHCVAACVEALRAAFADLRARQIEEFRGEKALVCTCFGVTEETIDDLICVDGLRSLGEIARTARAGSGCGSCRMILQEMLDTHAGKA